MRRKKIQSPQIVYWILCKILNKDIHFTLIGDFEEIYEEIANKKGVFLALLWYWGQITRLLPLFIYNKIYWGIAMFKNYMKIALRNVQKHKAYSFINISGLAIGLASCLFILLWVKDELSFDRFHENTNNLYRVESDEIYSGTKIHSQTTPPPMAFVLTKEIPEIEAATHCTRFGGMHIRYKDNVFFENNIRAVDPSFFSMFSFPLSKGRKSEVLKDRFSLVLTTKTARKLFGNEEPIGKTVTVENKWEMTVTGVITNPPPNSSIHFDGLVRFEFTRDQLERMPSGWRNAISTFIQLHDNASIGAVEQKITDLVQKHQKKKDSISEYQLNPLSKLHLFSSFGPRKHMGLIRYVYIFSLVAIFVLLIACINFMNLSTARSANRAKEIGIRKVVGASRINVIRQFFGESLLLSVIALILAIGIVFLLLPVFNQLAQKNLPISCLLDKFILFGIIAITIITGLFAGSYPALFLSSFKPVKVLNNLYNNTSKRSLLRKSLVVFQFSISIFLIIGTIVVYLQLHFMKNKDIGFNRKQVLYIRMTGETPNSFETLKSELVNHHGILSVSACGRRPSIKNDHGHNINWEGKDPAQTANVIFHTIDYNYVEMLDMKMVEGRSFSKKFPSDTTGAFIVNEELAKMIGGKSVIGKQFQIFWMKGKIIGVVKNFHHLPLHQEIQPMVMFLPPNAYWQSTLLAKIESEDIASTIAYIKKTWEKVVPFFPFEYKFLDEDYDLIYRFEERLVKLLNAFAILAIFIACLGLFGLASFIAEQRTKEIGIRKTLGASISKIILMLSKDFVKWVALANIIAWPIAWFILNNWLSDFAYRINIRLEIFIMSGFIAFVIALITVSFQAYKAARSNPVDALKYE